MTSHRPRGRDEVPLAVIEACERMCVSKSPSEFSTKELAAEASVTTSLLYFYFDSKDHILAETLRSIATEINEAALAEETPAKMVETAGEFMWNRPGFPRLLIALTLENRNITDIMGDHPFIRTLAKALADDSDVEDAREAAVVLITSAVSAAVLGRAANVAIGRDSEDPRIARELVQSALVNAGVA